jgi:ribonuclease-3
VRVGAVETDARDPKTSLQEWAQARAMPPPVYSELGREGPDHEPLFTVQVRLENGAAETASAKSKRIAEQLAARALLEHLKTAG